MISDRTYGETTSSYGVALREMVQRNVEWYSVHANSVALREMARRNVEWYSILTV